jgi:hypothetical protein
LQEPSGGSECTERLRLSTRMRVLEQDYTGGRVLLDKAAGGEHTRFLLRRLQEIERALGELRAAYESHVAEHGCAEVDPS